MPSVPFYADWQFWSAVAAVVAILLSQLPPVHVLLRRPKLRCEAFSRMHLTHKVGNPNAQWHLIVENKGGRAIRVKNIAVKFTKDGAYLFTLQAQNYLRTPDATENVMFTPFRLEPDEEWAHVLTFFNLFSRDDDKEYRRIESAIRSDILAKREKLTDKSQNVHAEPQILAKTMEFFEKHFKWAPGEYEVTLEIATDSPQADYSRAYRFSLFESESKELRDYSEGYSIGAGVFWSTPAQPGILVPINEK